MACSELPERITREFPMVERRSELNRRYHRKAKLRKLKNRLAQAKNESDRSKFLTKIKMLSPFWTPADAKPAATPKTERAEKPEKPARKPAKKAT
jgi:hypothetical protein